MEQTKRCSLCGAELGLDQFSGNGKNKRRPDCKKCEVKRVTRHRKKNPYEYLEIKCNKCSEKFKVRINKKPGLLAVICNKCFASQKQSNSTRR